MLKRDITYTDFFGTTVTESFYFNLTRTEIVELALEEEDIEDVIKRIQAASNNKALIQEFQRFILMSYGKVLEDGRIFDKKPEYVEEFKKTAAWDALFMEFLTVPNAAAEFFIGVLPKDLEETAKKTAEQLLDEIQTGVDANPKNVSQMPPPPPAKQL
jgi:hypothetical protein